MIFVDRNEVDKPEIFSSKEVKVAQEALEKFYRRPTDERAQEKFSKPFQSEIRNGFLPDLENLFNGKCAYCESPIDLGRGHSAYDHFRPRHGARGLEKEFSNDHYWWLTYEWENIYYCCEMCNQYKSTWFPVDGERAHAEAPYDRVANTEIRLLVDPCRDSPERHFTYKDNGEIDFLTPEGKVTIEILKLNRSELIEGRKNVLIGFKTDCEMYEQAFSERGRAWSEIEERLLSILKGDTKRPYLGIQRQFFSRYLSRSVYQHLRHNMLDYMYKEGESAVVEEPAAEYLYENVMDEKIQKFIQQKIDAVRHIYVEKIEVRNFKCFSFLEVDFNKSTYIAEIKATDRNPLVEPWLLFLGDNGVGKSSLLKAMVIGLSGNEYIGDMGIKGSDLLKYGEKEGAITIHLVGAVKPIVVNFDENTIKSTNDQPIVNLVAYNSIRLMPKKGKLYPEDVEVFYGARAKNLFDYTYTLTDARFWLLTRDKNALNRDALALKDLMMLGEDERIERNENDGTIYVLRKGEQSRIEDLSDGYQSIYAMAVDIMSTLAGDNVTYDLAEGMVFIDEIGTHLHPKWRMQVVKQLRNCFPKIRFVVTTHEPLCLKGLKDGEIVVLARDEDKKVVAITDLPDPSSLRVDQLLTSEFFGLKSTIDPDTEEAFNEYYAILALDEPDRTKEQKDRLLVLNERISKIKNLGETLREELICDVIDELLAKKVRKDGLRIKEDISREAIERVKSLWEQIEQQNRQGI